MTPKMEAALRSALAAGDDGLHWTVAGWQGPADDIMTYHGPVIVSRLVWHHGYLAERGTGRGKNARRIITDKGRAYLDQHAAQPEYISKGATISADGRYRYHLWREWRLHPKPAKWHMWTDAKGRPIVDGAGAQLGEPKSCIFIMLNPSTADGEQDDPTIRRCVSFAKAWGYDRLDVLNLFAHRATDPKELLRLSHFDDPVGVGNQNAFQKVLLNGYRVGTIICAWGAHGAHLGQDETALGWLEDRKRYALGLTKDGHPKHPLYLPSSAQPREFRL